MGFAGRIISSTLLIAGEFSSSALVHITQSLIDLLQFGKRTSSTSYSVADAGTSVDCGHEE